MEVFGLADRQGDDCARGGGQCRVYRRRWLMLVLFSLCSACNAAHWIQYSIITNVVIQYYGVSAMAVNWTSMIFMAVYVPLVFPASWLLEKRGLRVCVTLGTFLVVVGAWLKLLAVGRDGFPIAFAAQTVIGVAQMFTLGVPAKLAAVWFPHRQVSTATAIGVFGNQIGIAIGFVVPPEIVNEAANPAVIAEQLTMLYLGMAIAPTIVFLLIIVYFEGEPPIPPSLAQATAIQANTASKSYSQSVKELLTNKNFVLLLASFGLNIGAFYAYSTLLNQLFLEHFKDGMEDAGQVGLTLVLAGVVGSVVWGVVLDKTHKYKETTLGVYLMSGLGMLAFTFMLRAERLIPVYVTSGFLGFFMNGYLTVGYEFGAELTYPHSESTSSGLLNAAGEVCGVTSVLVAGAVFQNYGDFATDLGLSAMLLLGLLLSIFIDGSHLRRQEASRRPVYVTPVIANMTSDSIDSKPRKYSK
nr:PREDICTED: uncharacterized MFS-type transporter C09D4.1-like isoform X3 [Bemisia tabaci]